MTPRFLATVAIVAGVSMTAAHAAPATDLTIYRSDSDSLFAAADRGSLASGYALVHETRQLDLKSGRQVISLDGLPEQLDAEALDLRFPGRKDIRSLASRLLLPDQSSVLATHVGQPVTVIGDNGQTLAAGTLLGERNGLLVRDAQGVSLVRNYAAVRLGQEDVRGGVRLAASIESGKAGQATAKLDYPTGGMGWRAAYTGTLVESGAGCQLNLASDASIANRSGRDWDAATLKLVAGEPRFARSSGPQPRMMAMAAQAAPAPESHPQQAAMGDYRSYTIDGAIDLPDGSITRVPLYAPRNIDCQRSWLFEHGSAWLPARPQLARGFNRGGEDRISSHLKFTAFDNLPAGYLRVNGIFNGQHELLGEARLADTPRGQPVDVTLGTAFDLRGKRERSAFSLDRAARTLDESFRITLSNGGDSDRSVTVREHPDRWRSWTLVSSSVQPARKTADTLDFTISVPARGQAVLDYSLRYQWTANDE